LALDLNNEQTGRYSSKRGEFTGYVINPTGTITGIFDGNLRNRAKSKELLDAIQAAASEGSSMKEGSSKKAGSDTKAGSGAKAGSSSKAASGSKGSGLK